MTSRIASTVTFVSFAAAVGLVLLYNVPQEQPVGSQDPPQAVSASAVVDYAPVVTAATVRGAVDHIDIPCTKACANGSTACKGDVCLCDADHYGRTCQLGYETTTVFRNTSKAKKARDQEHINSKLYFKSPTAQSRQQLAAVNLLHCPSILEVGGLMAGTLQHLTRLGWAGNFTQMDMFGPQDANVTRTTLANGEVRVRRVVRSRQLCGENATEEAAHACFVFLGIPAYGGMGACAAGVHAAKYETIILESPYSKMFDVFAVALQRSPQYKSWGTAADWSEDLRRDGVNREFEPRRFRVFNRVSKSGV